MKKDLKQLGLANLVPIIYEASKEDDFATVKTTTLESWLAANNLPLGLDWFVPQLLAYISSSWKERLVWENEKIVDFLEPVKLRMPALMNVEDANRYVDSRDFAAEIKQEWFDYMIYALCKLDRNTFFRVPTGTRAPLAHYKSPWNTAVPLVMAAFKMYGSIGYDKWTLAAAKKVSHKALANFIGSEIPQELTIEDRLALRQEATMTRARQEKPQASINLIGSIKDYARGEDYREDRLYLHSLIQTWVMHPSNWTEYMIVDGSNLGKEPEVLSAAEIFKETPKKQLDEEIAPWLL